MPIIVEASAYSDKDLEELVDEDIAQFSAYFTSLGNDPMSKFEKAAIKTYLHWKTHGEPSSSSATPTSEGSDAEEAAG